MISHILVTNFFAKMQKAATLAKSKPSRGMRKTNLTDAKRQEAIRRLFSMCVEKDGQRKLPVNSYAKIATIMKSGGIFCLLTNLRTRQI